jgi:signal transduction histidine kinase
LALNQAAISITGELELDALLQRIVDEARKLVGCRYAALGVLGEDGFIARFPTSGVSQTEREQIGAPPRGHGLLGVMLRVGQVLRVSDMSKDNRRVGFPPHHPPMTSLLGVPIFVRGKLAGDLYLTDKYGGPEFSEEDEWLLQLLATHAATALTNAQLHIENVDALQKVRVQRARSQALLRVNQAINRSVHTDEVIELIIRSTLELLDVAGAAFHLLERPVSAQVVETAIDGGVQSFKARYAVGLHEMLTTNASELPIVGSVAGRAVASRTIQVVDDTQAEPDTIFPRLADKELRSLVAVPLVAGDKITGVLSVYSDQPRNFGVDSVSLLEAIGAAASTAIYNAVLYEEAEQGREAAEREGQRLRELEQMKDEFLSTAAHELRTPLTTVKMSIGLLQEQLQGMMDRGDAIDSRLLDLLALVDESSQRMHSLVNDLLDLTRLEQGRASLLLEEMDLREVVTASVEATGPLFESKDQHVNVHLPEVYCPVRGDRQRLEQIVINLLSNAHKYTPAGSRIVVRTIRSSDSCTVSVRDNGPGVPELERELVFDRFYRSTLHRKDRTPSTGLGLPIARKIAEMHGGRLWVEGAQGGGSIFTLELPTI